MTERDDRAQLAAGTHVACAFPDIERRARRRRLFRRLVPLLVILVLIITAWFLVGKGAA